MEPLGEAANQFAIVMLSFAPLINHLVGIAKIKTYASYLKVLESHKIAPDLPTICLTVIVKSYVDAAKSRMLVASKIEKSCGVKQAVK